MLTALLLSTTAAHAASCDAVLAKAASATPDTVAGIYVELAKCDKATAEASFNKYLEKAKDADSLGALAMAAIEVDTWKPLWSALGKITSYEARDEVARAVGGACTDHAKVVSFLQGAYFGLRDVEFGQWKQAFTACTDPKLLEWMDKQAASPPASVFDEKYDALLGVYVKIRRAEALPALQQGAIKAAAEGPFDMILGKMGEAVSPDLGEQADPADQTRLVAALIEVAKAAPPDKARSVANQLANSGDDKAAAQLLPIIYPGRAQGGAFVYGGASIEAGDCGGKKQAYIHFATVVEPGKRWTILGDIEAPFRAVKPKLGKDCKVEGSWPVLHSPEPIKAASDADGWAKTLVSEWTKKGFEVKLQREKDVKLP